MTSQITLEHGIPLGHPNQGRPPKYPFRQMGVGDSFTVAYGKEADAARTAMQRYSHKHGHKYMSRVFAGLEGGAVRIWRVS